MARVEDSVYKEYALSVLDKMAHETIAVLKPKGKKIDICVNMHFFEDWSRIKPLEEEYLEDFESEFDQENRIMNEMAMYNEFMDRIDFDHAYFVMGMRLLQLEDNPIVQGLISYDT